MPKKQAEKKQNDRVFQQSNNKIVDASRKIIAQREPGGKFGVGSAKSALSILVISINPATREDSKSALNLPAGFWEEKLGLLVSTGGCTRAMYFDLKAI
ncbi:hypothetical protein AGMMS4957_20820 [Bacteroidia bacterium]|nr:hypothetical protein AGMMS4957_20820 [Bacteroidia bacterium]